MSTRFIKFCFLAFCLFEMSMITNCAGGMQPVTMGSNTDPQTIGTAEASGNKNAPPVQAINHDSQGGNIAQPPSVTPAPYVAPPAAAPPVSAPPVSAPPVVAPTVSSSCTNDPHRPSVLDLMNRGVDENTASDLIYGVIGANYDTRNWAALLSGGSGAALVQAIRDATRQLYAGPYCRSSYAVRAPVTLGNDVVTLVAQSGNLEFLKYVNMATGQINYMIQIVDFEGYFLTSQTDRYINFGGSPSALSTFKAQIAAMGYSTTGL